MQLVSVLCLPVSSIPTSLSSFKSFCPCLYPFYDMHIVQAQLHRQLCNNRVYYVELQIVLAFLKKGDVAMHN